MISTNQCKITSLSLYLALLLVGCNNPQINSTQPDISVNTLQKNKSITGQVEFPTEFKTKATQNQIISETSVSLIYPANHLAKPNKVIATGLTNSNGGFLINTENSFTPYVGEIFILEANKRLGGTGSNSLSLRTNLKWNGTTFESITTPGIYINTKTTALSIMSGFSTILESDTIGKMNVVNGVTQISNINSTITSNVIESLNSFVEQSLTNNRDPIASIKFKNGRFYLSEDISESEMLAGCLGSNENCPSTLLPAPIPTVTPNPISSPVQVTTNPNPFGGCIGEDPNCNASPILNPLLGEFLVNTYITNSQDKPSIASNSNGDFVITWQSNGQDGNGNGIYAQKFNADGTPLGSEVRVNSYTSNSQSLPVITYLSNGDFVISWTSYGQDNYYDGVYAKRYNSAGVPQGPEFKVNANTIDSQTNSAIASTTNGGFIITWQSNGQDGSGFGIYTQKFNADSSTLGSEVRVNTYTTNSQENPVIASNSNGDFVISWQSNGQDGSGNGIYAKRYNSAGVPQGPEFKVNTYTTNNQENPAIASNSNGDFIIAWQSSGQDGSDYGLYAQRYSSTGVPQETEFRANTYTTNAQLNPMLISLPNNDFIIGWATYNTSTANIYGIYAQKFNYIGVPKGPEFRLNSYDTGTSFAAISSDNMGNFIGAWSVLGTSSYDIAAKKFN